MAKAAPEPFVGETPNMAPSMAHCKSCYISALVTVVRFGHKVGQIIQKWDVSGTFFLDQISEHFGSVDKSETFHIRFQNSLAPRFVPFGVDLTHYAPKS